MEKLKNGIESEIILAYHFIQTSHMLIINDEVKEVGQKKD